MKRGKTSTKVGGIDIGKRWLDVAAVGEAAGARMANDAAGAAAAVNWFRERRIGRVGLEASGGYERQVRQALEAAGLEVVVHQPLEVRLFARLKRLRAKNDRLDAALIAAATAQVDKVKAAADPQLAALAERLTAYEQVSDQAARLRTFMEHVTLADLTVQLKLQIRTLARLKRDLARQIVGQIKATPQLLARYSLLVSLPGIGPIVAASLVVRMPELGALARGQAAALLGVAPYDRDSGQYRGQRVIAGGRHRPRRMIYMAALTARRCDPTMKVFADRLAAKAKPPKVVLVAVMRRLIEAANLVLARGQPWLPQPTN